MQFTSYRSRGKIHLEVGQQLEYYLLVEIKQLVVHYFTTSSGGGLILIYCDYDMDNNVSMYRNCTMQCNSRVMSEDAKKKKTVTTSLHCTALDA